MKPEGARGADVSARRPLPAGLRNDLSAIPLRDVELPNIWCMQGPSQPQEAGVSHQEVNFLEPLPFFVRPLHWIANTPTAGIVRQVDHFPDLLIREFVVFYGMHCETQVPIEFGEDVHDGDV